MGVEVILTLTLSSLFQSIKGEQVTVLQNTTPFDTFSMTMLARSLLGQFFTGDLPPETA